MKKGILFITGFIFSLTAQAQFFGGDGDGSSVNTVATLNLSITNSNFTGGSNDGVSSATTTAVSLALTTPIYSGGADDGTGTASATSQALGITSPFSGGVNDGAGSASTTGVSLAVSSPFAGGSDDGVSTSSASALALGVTSATFAGGADDGVATVLKAAADLSLVTHYAGGADDGVGTVIKPAANLGIITPYSGGSDDGTGTVTATAIAVSPAGSMYAGGNDDGLSSISSPAANLGVPGMFSGGSNDGFAIVNAFSLFIALPVVWVDFTVTKNGEDAQLFWMVSNERNDDGFMVERSFDGVHFTDIGFVKAVNAFGATNKYNYTDKRPADFCTQGTCTEVYYRLRQIDLDQRFDYSVIRKLNLNEQRPSALVYPNPAEAEFFVRISNGRAKNVLYDVALYNSTGQLVYRQMHIQSLTTKIDARDFAPGIYFLTLTINNQIYSYPISITH